MANAAHNGQSFVSLAEIATSMGLDRSSARRYLLKEGVVFQRVRVPGSRGQQSLVVTRVDADAIVAKRRDGWGSASVQGSPVVNGVGSFYVVQLVPDLAPQRVKLGYAGNVSQRLQEHRCAAPTAELLQSWPCRATWEQTAIASITRDGCRSLTNEVYDCDDVSALIGRADAFFALMPSRSE